ncbi:hypothetical protein KFE25_004569 [Diacronema lutheri]|uniref:Uncharacterized protein n=1 Tax=Diacronema lutheri TaxID=2081491 RepID=A0A8J6C0W7_DIALT|nr:hypothetical protein KFE25_004569 [Diacronema lutheri]
MPTLVELDASAPRNAQGGEGSQADRLERLALAPPAKPAPPAGSAARAERGGDVADGAADGDGFGAPHGESREAGAPSATAELSSRFDYAALALARKDAAAARSAAPPAGARDGPLPDVLLLGIRTPPARGLSRRAYYASITHLHLDGQGIAELDCVTALPSLSVAYVRSNLLVSLAPFTKLARLAQLHADDNRITSLSDLAPTPSLRTLSLARNRLARVEGLRGATALLALNVSAQRGLGESPPAQRLARGSDGDGDDVGDGDGDGAAAVRPRALTFEEASMASLALSLESLKASACGLSDLSDLIGLASLTELDLSHNPLGASDALARELAELLNCSPRLASLRLAPSPLAAERPSRSARAPRGAAAHPPAGLVARAGGLRPFALRHATTALREIDGKPVGSNERHFVLAKAQAARAAVAERAWRARRAEAEEAALAHGENVGGQRAPRAALPAGMLPPPPPLPTTVAAAAATAAAADAARAAAEANREAESAGERAARRVPAVRAARPRSASSIRRQFELVPRVRAADAGAEGGGPAVHGFAI